MTLFRAKARGEYTVPPLPSYTFKASTTVALADTVLPKRHTWPEWCNVGIPACCWKCRAIHANGRSFIAVRSCIIKLYGSLITAHEFHLMARKLITGGILWHLHCRLERYIFISFSSCL